MEDWWGDVEREVLQCLEGRQAVPVGDVARRLGISELAAASLLALLAGGGGGAGASPLRAPPPGGRRGGGGGGGGGVRICAVQAPDAGRQAA